MRTVAILVFDDVEVLDFAGPYEVFNVTAELNQPTPFEVCTVAVAGSPIKTRGHLVVQPDYSIADLPAPDIVVIPGGSGSREVLQQSTVIDWLRELSGSVEYMLSVCTGSLVLAAAGLLDHKPATTHSTCFGELEHYAPTCTVVRDQRYVVNERLITSGGIAAGIDMSLYVVRRLCGDAILAKTLREMEYEWTPGLDLRWPAATAALQ